MCMIERYGVCLNYLLMWKNIIRMRIVLKIGTGKKQHLHCERLLSSYMLSEPDHWTLALETCLEDQKISTKIICFCWIALQEACSTQDNLNKRGLDLDNNAMCQKSTETVNHLLLHCAAAKVLWNMFCCILALGHATICERSLCKLEYMESWQVQESLGDDPWSYFLVFMN